MSKEIGFDESREGLRIDTIPGVVGNQFRRWWYHQRDWRVS